MDVFMITFVTHPIDIARQLFTRRPLIRGIALKTSITTPSSPDWISFCAASLSITCQCSFRWACYTTRPTMLSLRSNTYCVGITVWKGLSWVKNPMDNGFRQRITLLCMLEVLGVRSEERRVGTGGR